MVGLLVTILLGALVGWLASKVTGRDAEQNWVGNIVVGVAGAIVGSLFADLLDQSEGVSVFIEPTFWSLFWAFLGALLVSVALNYFNSRRTRR